jgi:hypothetical protein
MVYEYAISFDIKADSTYSDRYTSLMDQIRKTPDGSVWAETTSFVLLRSSENIETLADRLYFQTKISTSKDMLVVFDHVASACIARGPFEYPTTLKAHFKACDLK